MTDHIDSKNIQFKPVTKENWSDFETLFEERGGPSYCWCMLWRFTPEEKKDTSKAARKSYIKGRVERGEQIGLLGYLESKPILWCSIAPKELFYKVDGKLFEKEPKESVWSISCMFIKRSYRSQGLTRIIIENAVTFAKGQGATNVEAYPVLPESPTYRYCGIVPSFETQGFTEVSPVGKRRHLMRKQL